MSNKKTKLLLSEIDNIWHFVPDMKGVLVASDSGDTKYSWTSLYNFFKKKHLSSHENAMYAGDYDSSNGYYWVCYHSFTAFNYDTKHKRVISENTILYPKYSQYESKERDLKAMGLVAFSFSKKYSYAPFSDHTTFIASVDELRKYTIPVFNSYYYKNMTTCFTLDKYEKTLLPIVHKEGLKDTYRNEKLTTIFHMYDVDSRWHESFIPLLGVLKEVYYFQDELILEKFLPNILSIINDAKKMIKSNIDSYDKEELMKETVEVMQKLRESICDICEFDYSSVKTWEEVFEELMASENEEKRQKEQERRELEIEKEEKKQEYLKTIRARSELLDAFNSKFSELGSEPYS